MNMRLRELAASMDKAGRDQEQVPADIAAPVHTTPQAAATPSPAAVFVAAPAPTPQSGGMSALSELCAKVSAAKQARQKMVGDLMAEHEAVEKQVADVLAAVQTDIDGTRQEVEALKASR
jgi:hypothetical protein